MIICLLGKPACGKTTLAFMLSDYFRIHYIAIGQLIRDAAFGNNSEGISKTIFTRLSNNLVKRLPIEDQVISDLVVELMLKHKNIIIDNYPDTEIQVSHIKPRLEEFIIFNIFVSNNISKHRFSIRKREDFKQSNWKNRMAIYEETTRKALRMLSGSLNVILINNENSPIIAFWNILKVIEKKYG